MNSKVLSLLLPLLSLTVACGQEPADEGAPAETTPRVQAIELTRVALVGNDAPMLLHPVRVEVEAEVTADAFAGDLLVGLSDGEGGGCILGAAELVHDGEGTSVSADAEFFLDADCAPLAGRDDVEVFAAFDPWGRLDHGDRTYAEAGTMFETVRAAALPTEDCRDCDIATSVEESPGRDAQLRAVELNSSVAVIKVAATPGDELAVAASQPHFAVSNAVRVTGMEKGETLGDDSMGLRYRIRPLPGTDAADDLDPRAQGFVSLQSRRDGELSQLRDVDASGQVPNNSAAAVYIDGEAYGLMVGAWAGVEEFELETCIVSTFDEATYRGEGGPRANNCAVLPVVVVREATLADGSPAPTARDQLEGGAKSRQADAWNTGWSTSNGSLGTTGFSLDLWVELNSSDTSTSTYGGKPVNYPGSWFEAGSRATGTVFDASRTLLDIYASFIAYNGGGGAVHLGAQLIGYDFLSPISIDTTEDDLTLTLQDILDAANSDAEPVFSKDVSIVGFSFDDGCGGVNAGIWANGSIGIDTEETSVTLRVQPGAASVSGTFNPYAAISASAGVEATYGGFLSGSLTATVDLIRADVPFTATATLNHVNGDPTSLVLTQAADLVLTALSGNVTFSTNWEGCWLFCDAVNHSHELVSWDGLSNTYNLFDLSQTIDLGDDNAAFCNAYDGQSIRLKTYHNKYLRATDASLGYVMDQVDWAQAWESFTVECQANGKVSLRTHHGRYVQALSDGGMNQQTFPGAWEQFDVRQSNGKWGFGSYHGTFMQALNNSGMNQQTFIGGWEEFSVE